jgi:hypothetical protein
MKPDRDNEFEDEFMKELKSAISDRNATLDEVVAVINKEGVAAPLGISKDRIIDRLIHAIEALKTPARL